MAAAPGVSWDLILWRGKREDLRDLTELSGVHEGQYWGDGVARKTSGRGGDSHGSLHNVE